MLFRSDNVQSTFRAASVTGPAIYYLGETFSELEIIFIIIIIIITIIIIIITIINVIIIV